MALKAIVDSLDNVEEAAQAYYKEQDGKYVLDLDDSVKEHPEVSSLKNAYEKEQEKRRKAAEDRDKYKEIADKVPDDFDADEYEKLKAHGDPSEDVQKKVEEARERERKRHEKTIEQLKSENKDLSEKYTGTKKNIGLKESLSEVNVAPHLREYAEEYWSNRAQIDDDGNLVTKDGTPLNEAIKEWAESEKGSYFIAAPGNGGGGALGGKAGGTTKDNPWSKEGQNLTKQMEIKNKDPERAARLKAEAGAE